MPSSETSFISDWFEKLNGDGEFVRDIRAEPYSVIGPASNADLVIFATKPRVVAAAFENGLASDRCCLLGRPGLPRDDDTAWLRDLIQHRRVLFLGDMDPVELLIFAWLRSRLRPIEVVHLGISDAYLDALGCSNLSSWTIDLAPSEQQSMSVLQQALPDLHELLGTKCHQLLEHGKKFELEAIVSIMGSHSALLSPISKF